MMYWAEKSSLATLLAKKESDFLAALLHAAKFIEVTEQGAACRDSKDNKFLELAVSDQATCVVTGDNDLLVLHPFREIPILSF